MCTTEIICLRISFISCITYNSNTAFDTGIGILGVFTSWRVCLECFQLLTAPMSFVLGYYWNTIVQNCPGACDLWHVAVLEFFTLWLVPFLCPGEQEVLGFHCYRPRMYEGSFNVLVSLADCVPHLLDQYTPAALMVLVLPTRLSCNGRIVALKYSTERLRAFLNVGSRTAVSSIWCMYCLKLTFCEKLQIWYGAWLDLGVWLLTTRLARLSEYDQCCWMYVLAASSRCMGCVLRSNFDEFVCFSRHYVGKNVQENLSYILPFIEIDVCRNLQADFSEIGEKCWKLFDWGEICFIGFFRSGKGDINKIGENWELLTCVNSPLANFFMYLAQVQCLKRQMAVHPVEVKPMWSEHLRSKWELESSSPGARFPLQLQH